MLPLSALAAVNRRRECLLGYCVPLHMYALYKWYSLFSFKNIERIYFWIIFLWNHIVFCTGWGQVEQNRPSETWVIQINNRDCWNTSVYIICLLYFCTVLLFISPSKTHREIFSESFYAPKIRVPESFHSGVDSGEEMKPNLDCNYSFHQNLIWRQNDFNLVPNQLEKFYYNLDLIYYN